MNLLLVDDEIAIVGDVMRKKAIFSVFLAWANQPGLVAVSWKKLLQENCNLFLPSHGREITRELLEKEGNSKGFYGLQYGSCTGHYQ